MILKVPVTATNIVEWVRRAAGAINSLISQAVDLDGRVTTVEMTEAATDAALTALDSRADALEAFAALPFTVASVTFTPVALPGTPAKGMTVYDIADDKVKTWNGAAWQAHW